MIDINFIDGGTDERILKSLVGDNGIDQEELEKAIRDRSKLVPKVITDKNGHRKTVYVRGGAAPAAQPKDAGSNSAIPEKVKGRNMGELADNLEKHGFKLDAADRRSPYKRVTMTRGNKEYTATFNKYSDGGVEVINIRPSY